MNLICNVLNTMPLQELVRLADDGCTFDIEDGKITNVYEEESDGR